MPDKADLEEATRKRLDGPCEVVISLHTSKDNQAELRYDTKVLSNGSDFSEKGSAEITIAGLAFSQDCETVRQEGQSYKYLRNSFVPAEQDSPCTALLSLLPGILKSGEFGEAKVPVTDVIPDYEGEEQTFYCLSKKGVSIPWGAFCDACIDSFLWEEPFPFDSADVRLYFGSQSKALCYMEISASTEGQSLAGEIRISAAEEMPATLAETEIDRSEGLSDSLYENWSLSGSLTELPYKEPEKETLSRLEAEWKIGTTAFSLWDTVLPLSSSLSEILDAGFKVKSQEETGSFTAYTVSSKQSTDNFVVLCRTKDSSVSEIMLFYEDMPFTPVGLPGGLTFGSTLSEIEAKWGSPQTDGTYSLPGGFSATVYEVDGSVYGLSIAAPDAIT